MSSAPRSAVDSVGALPAPLVGLLQHPDDGDALLLPRVLQRRHPLGVLQPPAGPLVYQHPHQRDVAKPDTVIDVTSSGNPGQNKTYQLILIG